VNWLRVTLIGALAGLVAALAIAGRLFAEGPPSGSISRTYEAAGLAVIGGLAAGILAACVYWMWKRRQAKRGKALIGFASVEWLGLPLIIAGGGFPGATKVLHNAAVGRDLGLNRPHDPLVSADAVDRLGLGSLVSTYLRDPC
jgi:hypothetical protein